MDTDNHRPDDHPDDHPDDRPDDHAADRPDDRSDDRADERGDDRSVDRGDNRADQRADDRPDDHVDERGADSMHWSDSVHRSDSVNPSDAVDSSDSANPSDSESAGYRRSAGSVRGQARRRELLELVTADVAANGLVDFSLRRAAKAAGTTHKVLLYHFDGVEELLRLAVEQLRELRVQKGRAAALAPGHASTLAERIRLVWPVLTGSDFGERALDQALGLAMFDPDRYGPLAVDATERLLPPIRALCPQAWSEQRKDEVAELILAALRGFLVQRRTSPDGETGGEAGLAALLRMLEREQAEA